MFYKAGNFNKYTPYWSTGKVRDTSSMFRESVKYNQWMAWDLRECTDTSYMFFKSKKFNKDVGNLRIDNVKHVNSMFEYSFVFNKWVGAFNTKNVIDMSFMFRVSFGWPFCSDISLLLFTLHPR